MRKTDESLGRRLRYAALDRVHTGSERVDDFVLDADGVIDLRVFDGEQGGTSIAAPAAALASIRGQLGDAGEISELYDESEPDPPRWRLGWRAHHTAGDEAPSAATGPVFPSPLAEADPTLEATEIEPDIDRRDEDRPTAECPLCASVGHRDLFDRFSQVEFYSCDSCAHMWQRDHS